jgi:hypothetical protein
MGRAGIRSWRTSRSAVWVEENTAPKGIRSIVSNFDLEVNEKGGKIVFKEHLLCNVKNGSV